MKTLLEMFNIQGDRNNSQYVKYLDCNVFGEVRDISDNEKDSHCSARFFFYLNPCVNINFITEP